MAQTKPLDLMAPIADGKPTSTEPTSGTTAPSTIQPVAAKPSAELAANQTTVSDNAQVGNQLNDLLKSDSPYIQEARLQGQQEASNRGLQNSSIAAGASQRAAIQSALPIAQQDASLFGQADLQDSAYTQQGAINAQNYQNTASLNEQNTSNQAQLNAQSENNQGRLTAEQHAHDQIAQMGQNLNTQVANIEQNPDMSAQQKNDAIQNLVNLHNATINAIQKSQNLAQTKFTFAPTTSAPVSTPVAAPGPGQPPPSTNMVRPPPGMTQQEVDGNGQGTTGGDTSTQYSRSAKRLI